MLVIHNEANKPLKFKVFLFSPSILTCTNRANQADNAGTISIIINNLLSVNK